MQKHRKKTFLQNYEQCEFTSKFSNAVVGKCKKFARLALVRDVWVDGDKSFKEKSH